MITFATWQFSHFFLNGGVGRLVINNTVVTWKKWNKMLKQESNEDMKKKKEKMWKKDRSINKEDKKRTHIYT